MSIILEKKNFFKIILVPASNVSFQIFHVKKKIFKSFSKNFYKNTDFFQIQISNTVIELMLRMKNAIYKVYKTSDYEKNICNKSQFFLFVLYHPINGSIIFTNSDPIIWTSSSEKIFRNSSQLFCPYDKTGKCFCLKKLQTYLIFYIRDNFCKTWERYEFDL